MTITAPPVPWHVLGSGDGEADPLRCEDAPRDVMTPEYTGSMATTYGTVGLRGHALRHRCGGLSARVAALGDETGRGGGCSCSRSWADSASKRVPATCLRGTPGWRAPASWPSGGEVERDSAAVAGGRGPLQQAGVDQPVDHLGDRAGRDAEAGGQVGRPQARGPGRRRAGPAPGAARAPRGPDRPARRTAAGRRRRSRARPGSARPARRRPRVSGNARPSLALIRLPHYEVTSIIFLSRKEWCAWLAFPSPHPPAPVCPTASPAVPAAPVVTAVAAAPDGSTPPTAPSSPSPP